MKHWIFFTIFVNFSTSTFSLKLSSSGSFSQKLECMHLMLTIQGTPCNSKHHGFAHFGTLNDGMAWMERYAQNPAASPVAIGQNTTFKHTTHHQHASTIIRTWYDIVWFIPDQTCWQRILGLLKIASIADANILIVSRLLPWIEWNAKVAKSQWVTKRFTRLCLLHILKWLQKLPNKSEANI